MKLFKILAAFLMLSIISTAHAELTPDDQLFFDQIIEGYDLSKKYIDNETLKSKEKLIEVEDSINRLKK